MNLIGHALTVAIQDSLCRYHRMNGRPVVWYGGTDHAGIATQMVVEKILWNKFKKTRHDVSKEEFDQIFNQWCTDRQEEIDSQLKSLGVSIDLKQNFFTLSSEMSNHVAEAFIQLFERGLIYRASYMVNWSYYLQSTLSDIEIEHKFISKPTMFEVPGCNEKFQLGVMHYFKYPLDSGDHIEIATTRLESLMGDVALCVHPSDSRYQHMIGCHALSPYTQDKLPIIADEAVKPDFGTGVLKITPAHCLTDWEIAQRHGLPLKSVYDQRGNICCDYQSFNGVHRYAAKKLVQEDLERRGLYSGYKDHPHWLPLCSRSGDIIESKIVPQWFLKTDEARYMAEFCVNRDNLSDESKEKWTKLKSKLNKNDQNIVIVPSSYRNTWKDWFSRYKDWCVSRQIHYGHRIPAYNAILDGKETDVWVAAKK